MQFEDLTAEQQERLRACTSEEELIELAKSAGCELSEDELAAIAGGRHRKKCSGYVNPFPLRECPVQKEIGDLPVG